MLFWWTLMASSYGTHEASALMPEIIASQKTEWEDIIKIQNGISCCLFCFAKFQSLKQWPAPSHSWVLKKTNETWTVVFYLGLPIGKMISRISVKEAGFLLRDLQHVPLWLVDTFRFMMGTHQAWRVWKGESHHCYWRLGGNNCKSHLNG